MENNKIIEEMNSRVITYKKILLEHLKGKNLLEDKDLIDKINSAFKKNGDLNFKKGMAYMSNLINGSLNKTVDLKIFEEIPYTFFLEGKKDPVAKFSAYIENLTEEQAKSLQFDVGYPDNIFGFYHFKNIFGECYTWQCYTTVKD